MRAIVTFNTHSGPSIRSSSEPLIGSVTEVAEFARQFSEGRYPVITVEQRDHFDSLREAGYRGELEWYPDRLETIGFRDGWVSVAQRSAEYLAMRG